jgi:hypothetical protein
VKRVPLLSLLFFCLAAAAFNIPSNASIAMIVAVLHPILQHGFCYVLSLKKRGKVVPVLN